MTQLEENLRDRFRDFRIALDSVAEDRLGSKVDKVTGKQLSTNDYTTAEKNKLANLASITTAGDNITITGGKISAANTTYTAGDNITIQGGTISGTANTTYSAATTTTSGLMSASDKSKLNNLASITSAGNNITIQGGTISGTANTTYSAGSNITISSSNVISGTANTTYSAATTTTSGLMSAADKSKLNNLASITSAGSNITIQGGTISAGAGATYSAATTTQAGLMSASDKSKLNNLASITSAGNNITIQGGTISAANTTYTAGDNITISNGVISGTANTTYTAGNNITISGGTISAKDTTYTVATSSTDGLMSAADKASLDVLFQSTSDFVDTVLAGIGGKLKPAASTVSQFLNSANQIQFFDSKLQKIISGSDGAYAYSTVDNSFLGGSEHVEIVWNAAETKASLAGTYSGLGVSLAGTGNSTLNYYYEYHQISDNMGFVCRDNCSISSNGNSIKSGVSYVYPFLVDDTGKPSLGSGISLLPASSSWADPDSDYGVFPDSTVFNPFHVYFWSYTSAGDGKFSSLLFDSRTPAATLITPLTTYSVENVSSWFNRAKFTFSADSVTITSTGGRIAPARNDPFSGDEPWYYFYLGVGKQPLTDFKYTGTLPCFGTSSYPLAGTWLNKDKNKLYLISFKTGTYNLDTDWFDTAAKIYEVTPRPFAVTLSSKKLSKIIDTLDL